MREILAITKALSDESRLRALAAVRHGELCLCQLIDVLGLAPATVSKHMDILERAGLVERRRKGRWRFYRLVQGGVNQYPARAVEWILEALRADSRIAEDARKVRRVRHKALEELSACYRS
jgi:DNA-binding transcriptional ArsR family regulator